MRKQKSAKRTLLMSVISMLMCCAMLIGTTFAWFTDTVTSGKNKIVAGNLDIELNYMKDGKWVDASTAEEGELFNTDSPWEPGKVVYEQFQISNMGSLAVKYFLSFRDVVMNEVLIPDGEGGYTYPTVTWDGEETEMQYNLMDVLQVACYKGTFAQLQAAVGGELTGRELVQEAVKNDLISFVDEDGNYNSIWDNFEIHSALAPAGVYKGEDGADDSALDPVDFHLVKIGTNVGGNVVDEDDNNIYIDVSDAIDTEEYTIFLYWEPNAIPMHEGEDIVPALTDNSYNLNNGKIATPVITDELEGEIERNFEADPGEETDFDQFRIKYFSENAEDSLKIEFNVSAYATQIPFEEDSFGSEYDDELNWGTESPAEDPKI